jgi:hypothetical protein
VNGSPIRRSENYVVRAVLRPNRDGGADTREGQPADDLLAQPMLQVKGISENVGVSAALTREEA